MGRALVPWLVVALLAGAASIAGADPESTELFERGRALAKEGKYEEACAKFEASLELDRAPGTLLNYADCHEHLGHFALAWRLFDEAARKSDAENNIERASFARDRAQALVPKTSTIVVRLATPELRGLSVSIAGRSAVPAAEIREVVDPGEITVEVGGPDLRTFRRRERVEPGLQLVIEVPPLSRGEDVEHRPITERRRSRVIAAYTLGALGSGGLVAGVIMGAVAKSRYDAEIDTGNCTATDGRPLCNEIGYANQGSAITIANLGTGVAVAGVVVLAASAVVFLTAPRDVVVIPTASAEAGGLAVVGRF